MKKTIVKPSAVPILGIGGVWLVYGLCLPMYRPWHLVFPVLASAAAFFVLSLAGGLVIKFTPMPEKWGFALIVFFMSLVCFTAGIYAGFCHENVC